MADVDFETLEELNEAAEESDGVVSVEMWQVRDAYGQDRLGIHVRAGIHKALAKLGLGHYPEEVPDRQGETLRVYKLGSPVASLIGAVLTPGDDGDALIREAVGGDDAEIVGKIRELVC
jgi:hypothetical protein